MPEAKEKILSVKEMRDVDAKAVSLGLPILLMMENAGNALARYMLQGLQDLHQKKVTVVCGLSNNGGGGFASARHLAYYGANVTVVLLGIPETIKTTDAKLQWKTIEQLKHIPKITITSVKQIHVVKTTIAKSDGIVDAIIGTGYSSAKIREPASSIIDLINASQAYIVSNDVPSGIDADTGLIPDKAVSPDIIVTLHRMKLGLTKNHLITTAIANIGISPESEMHR